MRGPNVPADLLPIPAAIEPVDFIQRWADIVERRRVQMDNAYAEAGINNADYWGKRAKTYRQAFRAHADEDPFFLRVRACVDPTATVLDVGSGPGRHTLALAPHVRRVVAVDPSPAMLGLLREDLAEQGLTNVDVVESEWLEAQVAPADVVICSHVLYPIADPVPFIEKLNGSAGTRVFVYLRTDPLATDLGLWSAFHAIPLQSQPVHTDLMGVLSQMGICPDVEIVEHRFTWTFADLDEAHGQLRNSLRLRADDDAASAKLRALLSETLVEWPDGRLGPRLVRARSAILSWTPISR